MVKAWVEFVQRPDVQRHVVFLSDYDLVLAERLVQGAALISGSTLLAGRGKPAARAE
jgi:hypothetical protein